MKNNKTISWAIINSLGTFIYSSVTAYIMSSAERFFGKMDGLISIIAFLMLFTLSAVVVGTLILGRPIILYVDGQKKESVKLLLQTIVALFLITSVVFLIHILIN